MNCFDSSDKSSSLGISNPLMINDTAFPSGNIFARLPRLNLSDKNACNLAADSNPSQSIKFLKFSNKEFNSSPDCFFSIDHINKNFFESPERIPDSLIVEHIPARIISKASCFVQNQTFDSLNDVQYGVRAKKKFDLEIIEDQRGSSHIFHSSLSYATKKISHLSNLYNTLTQMFLYNERVELSGLEFSLVERVLFILLIERKCGQSKSVIQSNYSVVPVSFLQDSMNKFEMLKSEKRIEERKKFIYKNVLKKLKNDSLDSEIKAGDEGKIAINSFLHRYFEIPDESYFKSLQHYIDPLNVADKERKFKTLSKDFFVFLFKNKKLYCDFITYLKSPNFIIDYQRRVQKKIEKLLTRWERMIRGGTNTTVVLSTIEKYFKHNKQCKLPWTRNEILHAIGTFEKFITRLQGQINFNFD
jgi:hypothetical protein